MKYPLYEHQQKGFSEIVSLIESGEKSILYVLPTRGGKSGVISALIEHYAGKVIWFLAHTEILLRQMSDELFEHGIRHGIIAPWAPRIKYRVQVVSKDTLINRAAAMRRQGWPDPEIIIIDEAHLGMGDGYRELLAQYDAIKIGATGTACRLDNRPLGDIFSAIVHGPDHYYLQDKRILCPVKTYKAEFAYEGEADDANIEDLEEDLSRRAILKDIVNHWEEVAKGKTTLTFCVSIKHAEAMAAEFTEAGYPSVAISSRDGQEEIKEKLADFYSGKYVNLCSVNLFLMGFHVKDCECIIQARPTESEMIYRQSTGRGMMYLPGKVLINIDAVNNWKRHGYPDDPRVYKLEVGPKGDYYVSKYKHCPECYYDLVPKGARVCPDCGAVVVKDATVSRIPEFETGVLRETVSVREAILENAVSVVDARGIAHTLGYDPAIGERIYRGVVDGRCKESYR